MKIALIGPGLMPIPSKGWGGVEGLIWQYYNKLSALGHEVVIFNSRDLKQVARNINSGDFDFIHLHYDEYVNFFVSHLNKPFCATSHYGYIMKENKWALGYFSIFADFFKVPGIIAISKEIQQKFLNAGYSGQTYVVKVGIDVQNYKINTLGNGKAICLGKIESRKKQAFLAKELDGLVDFDFVGPNADSTFRAGETTRYLGSWTKEEVFQKLTEYSCLVLFSDGEAAPMVVPEALAAGLSVVISRSASANLDKKEFISVLSDDIFDRKILAEAINKQIKSNHLWRKQAREYANKTFDNEVIMRDYLASANDFIEKSKKGTVFCKTKKWRPTSISISKYLLSSIWRGCSHVTLFRKVLGFWRTKGYNELFKS